MSETTESFVQTREDWWVDVPAATIDGNVGLRVQLRPGTDDMKMAIKLAPGAEVEVDLSDLQAGIQRVVRRVEEIG